MDRELERGVVVVGNKEIKTGQIIWYSSYSAAHFYDEEEGHFQCLATEDIMVFEGGVAKKEDFVSKNDNLEVSNTIKTN